MDRDESQGPGSEMSDQIKQVVRDFILYHFLPGENSEKLTDSTPLITGGILDSIATLKLVSLLEEQYLVRFQSDETDAEDWNTIADIAVLVEGKLKK